MAEDVIKSTGRAFAVLELFEQRQQPLPAAQIERALALPQSSTLALLKSLVTLGYLAFDPVSRLYAPSLRLAWLGGWVGRAAVGGRLDALMRDLAEATGETVAITSQNDLTMQFLSIRPGRNPLTLNLAAGARVPLFQSTVGQVALAAREDADIRFLASRASRAETAGGDAFDLAKVMDEIACVRRDGHAIGYGRYTPLIAAIALPLPGRTDAMPLVVSIAGPIDAIAAAEATILARAKAILARHAKVADHDA